MKALVLTEPGRLEYVDVPEPSPGPGEVMLHVRACGICGSDVHGLDGSTGRRVPPLIMGHEAAGIVVASGPGVSDWRQGDRVTFDSTIYCGTCWFCGAGLVNLCEDRRVLGVSCADYRRHGAMAELVVVPQRVLYRIPDGVSFVEAALVEPLSVAAHAVAQYPVRPDTTAAVVGSGIIGLLLIQTLRAAGCTRVIAIDVNAERLDRAILLGAELAVRPDEGDAPETIHRHTDGLGVDVVFEAVGIGPTVSLAAQIVRKNGTIVLVGNLAPVVDFPLQSIVTRQVTVKGSTASCGEYPTCIDLIAQRRLDVSALVSAVAPLSDGAVWFDRLVNGQGELLKVVLEPCMTRSADLDAAAAAGRGVHPTA